AAVNAARVQGAAQRADRTLVGGAVTHVFGVEASLADAAGRAAGLDVDQRQRRAPRQVVATARDPGDEGHADETDAQTQEVRQLAGSSAEPAEVSEDAEGRGQRHRQHTY